MKQKIISITLLLITLLIGFEVLTETSDIIKSMQYSFNIWKDSIFPSLFPFFVISQILIEFGFAEFLGELLKNVMYKVFGLKGECSFVFVMSMLSGFPSSAKYTKELYTKGVINEYEATKLLTFTHFSNPLFIIGTISILFIGNKSVAVIIMFAHYITNIIIGIIFKNYYISEKSDTKISIRKAINKMNNKRINNDKNFGQIITSALNNAISTLLLMLGVISLFLVITTIINKNLNIDPYSKSILSGIFEMTQGLRYVGELGIPLKLKVLLSTMMISFGGLSVHMQILSIISDTKIKYFPYFTARILHALISLIIIYLTFDIYIRFLG